MMLVSSMISKINFKRSIIPVICVISFLSFTEKNQAQTAEKLLEEVKAKLNKVNDYEATAKLKTNVIFIKVPIATVKIYFKAPNKLKIHNLNGISLVPTGSVNINFNNLLTNTSSYDLIDVGKEEGTGLRIIKLLPKDDSDEIVLSTLYIDEKLGLIKKAKTTTKENGTYELEMTYGKYTDNGLADKLVFSFNIKNYKLPKGITFDYDVGKKKNADENQLMNKKGKMEITYLNYIINKGVPDSVFSK